MEFVKNTVGSGIFVQIGAGAGDLDSRANHRDGFSEFVKALPKERINHVILVEPNPINIPFLKKCWQDYPQANIVEIAIVPKKASCQNLDFFYAENDGPHFQVASINVEHVRKHYDESVNICKISVPTIDLESFLNQHIGNDEIELLSLDIEGIDADVILDTDFNNINLKFLSYEHLHLGDLAKNVAQHLNDCKLTFRGRGVDHNGYDHLCEKMV